MFPPLPQALVDYLAGRGVRQHHYLWHLVRGQWLDPTGFTPAQRERIKQMGWVPPRRAAGPDGVMLQNNSGEDFLYMHRQMIADANKVLADAGYPDHPRIEGWHLIPRPDDADWPVPPQFDASLPFAAALNEAKSDTFFNTRIAPLEQRYTDPAYLSTVSLGEFGARLEFSIHNAMHLRWAGQLPAYRLEDPADLTSVDSRWDDPAYDWLADTYSSHVNAVFWKLHGWVDARIDDWVRANGGTGEPVWKGTWVGPDGHPHMHLPVALDEPAIETEHALLALLTTAPAARRNPFPVLIT